MTHKWGEFYEVRCLLRFDRAPEDWQIRDVGAGGLPHFLFYFRDHDFECDARSRTLRI